VIGLYLNPPAKALILCCDEKSQCQALERSQPGLPLGTGHVRTRTHDYTRHGTVTLLAAMNYLDGRILSKTASRHTHVEWLAFLLADRPAVTATVIVARCSRHRLTCPPSTRRSKWLVLPPPSIPARVADRSGGIDRSQHASSVRTGHGVPE